MLETSLSNASPVPSKHITMVLPVAELSKVRRLSKISRGEIPYAPGGITSMGARMGRGTEIDACFFDPSLSVIDGFVGCGMGSEMICTLVGTFSF